MSETIENRIQRVMDGSCSDRDLAGLLALRSPVECRRLYNAAYRVKCREVGKKVRLRGIIEFSNKCGRDCLYCGIRRSNSAVQRYTMDAEEITSVAEWAYSQGYGSIVLQSGERRDSAFTEWVERLLVDINNRTDQALGITLSLGEQTRDTYERWFDAGASRYLLRIETSTPELFRKYHPQKQEFNQRLGCLIFLRDTGYQVGTGVMAGLPGQTCLDLARDILFFRDMDIDMVGMGPYIMHPDTPLAASAERVCGKDNAVLGLNMIACTRLLLADVNIAATTALQALDPVGREKGLLAGANVIMPNITPVRYRDRYLLYDGKPCTNENALQCRECLETRIRDIGEEIRYNERGDSPHFFSRTDRGAASRPGKLKGGADDPLDDWSRRRTTSGV